jgi:hypothetical protein
MNSCLMVQLDNVMLWSGLRGLQNLAPWVYFSGITANLKFMEWIFKKKQIIILKQGEKHAVFHNHVAVLLHVHINFRHYTDNMFCILGTTPKNYNSFPIISRLYRCPVELCICKVSVIVMYCLWLIRIRKDIWKSFVLYLQDIHL